jgi:hypothetical protein
VRARACSRACVRERERVGGKSFGDLKVGLVWRMS